MSILDSIKGERKLSFNHWRYRILHWAFGVENPDSRRPESTGLPKWELLGVKELSAGECYIGEIEGTSILYEYSSVRYYHGGKWNNYSTLN